MKPTKACPVILRERNAIDVLAFRHPLAGCQLVKGTIEPGENPAAAALRELREESGLAGAEVLSHLGIWESGYQDQIWSFHLCQMQHELPEVWVHHTDDDGGHDFTFFWHPLAEPPGAEWHEVFQGALGYIRTALAST